MAMIFDAGTPVLVETEFSKNEPFSNAVYFDPTLPKLTVIDPDGIVMVDGVSLIKQDTGKWYYVIQTVAGWAQGGYEVKVTCSDGTHTDITIARRSFLLK